LKINIFHGFVIFLGSIWLFYQGGVAFQLFRLDDVEVND